MNSRTSRRLFHGGHKGAESAFSLAAERWGVAETTLSFEGHTVQRGTNVEVLTEETLGEGRVSMEFVFHVLRRRFHAGEGFRRIIQLMFHTVIRSEEIFAVGWIQEDRTVKGGTGWGVELAKLFNRPVHVYDQDAEKWFTWREYRWVESEPVLPRSSFCGTGTRFLNEAGQRGIDELFQRSIGAEDKL